MSIKSDEPRIEDEIALALIRLSARQGASMDGSEIAVRSIASSDGHRMYIVMALKSSRDAQLAQLLAHVAGFANTAPGVWVLSAQEAEQLCRFGG